jgi:hypothetical protein
MKDARDGPGRVARLVGEDDSHPGTELQSAPAAAALKVVVVGLHELARLVLHLAVSELVLLRVGVLDIADRAD